MTLAKSFDKYISFSRYGSNTQLILLRTQGLYADICDELDRADPEDNDYCLLLSNAADCLDDFISGLERLEAGA